MERSWKEIHTLELGSGGDTIFLPVPWVFCSRGVCKLLDAPLGLGSGVQAGAAPLPCFGLVGRANR